MSNRPEPDDVDLFVGGVEPDARASLETAKAIEAYKKRSDYPFKAEEAERILAAVGIDARDYGMPDPESLLEHWHGCVAELRKANLGETSGTGVETEDIGLGSGLPSEESN